MSRVPVNGIHLNVDRRGAGPPLVLLHGFTGSLTTWEPFIPQLSERFEVISVDLIGHGLSDAPEDPDRYRMERATEDLAQLLDHFNVDRATWLGYSMGGRVALQFAVRYPERVTSLILEGASPGLKDSVERAARKRQDNALADRIERDGLDWFVDFWENIPLFASQKQLPAGASKKQRQQRLANRSVGLANSLRGMGQGAQPSVWERLSDLNMPVLLIAGAEDTRFRDLNAQMAERISQAEIVAVDGAGHAAHFEQPETFERIVFDFLGLNIGDIRERERV